MKVRSQAQLLVVAGLFLLAGWLLTGCEPPAPCTTSWVGPANGAFDVASSWSTNAVPGAADVACAPAGSSIVISSAASVKILRAASVAVEVAPAGSLTLGSSMSDIGTLTLRGTLTGDGGLRVWTLDWTGGTMSGHAVTSVMGDKVSNVAGPVMLAQTRTLVLGNGSFSYAKWSGTVQTCDAAHLRVGGRVVVATFPAGVTGAGCATVTDAHVSVDPAGILQLSRNTALARPFTNAGRVEITGTATLDLPASGVSQAVGSLDLLSSTSSVRVGGGTGTLAPAGGVIRGIGTVKAKLGGGATVAPGTTATNGALTVTGLYQPAAGGRLEVSVTRPADGPTDKLVVQDGYAVSQATLVVLSSGLFPGESARIVDGAVNGGPGAPPPGTFAEIVQPAPPQRSHVAVYGPATVDLFPSACDPARFHPRTVLSGQVVSGELMTGCSLSGAVASGLTINNTNLTHGDLSDSVFQGAQLTNVNLTNANLRGAVWSGTTFSAVTWSNTICPDGTNSDAHGASCEANLLTSTVTVPVTADPAPTPPGVGSLRAAVVQANASPGVTKIVLSGGSIYPLTIAGPDEDAGATGDLDVTGSILLTSSSFGATIDAAALDRVFDIRPGGALLIENIAVSSKSTAGTVRNDGSLLMQRSQLAGMSGPVLASSGALDLSNYVYLGAIGGGVAGPGIVNTGEAAVANVSITGGSVGLDNAGVIRLATTTFTNNTTGIHTTTDIDLPSTVTITGSTVGVDATARLTVGGTTIGGSQVAVRSAGSAVITSAVISGAQRGIVSTGDLNLSGTRLRDFADAAVTASGGAWISGSSLLHNGRGVVATGSLRIDSSTIADSAAAPAAGAAGGVIISGAGSTATILSSTIANNGAAGLVAAGGATTLSSSTVANNATSNIVRSGGTVVSTGSIIASRPLTSSGPSCAGGVLISHGWNLGSDVSCGLTKATDHQGVDPKLGSLGANLGSTALTILPLLGSPAVDGGPTICPVADQRGGFRPIDGDGDGNAVCDIGAVEVPTYRPLTLVVNSTGIGGDANLNDAVCQTATAGECTFVAATQQSAFTFGPDTIALPAGATIPLQTAVTLTAPVALQGNGATFDSAGTFGRLDIAGADDVTIGNVTIQGGSYVALTNPTAQTRITDSRLSASSILSTGKAGGSLVVERSTLTATNNAGVENRGRLQLVASTVISHDYGVYTVAGGTTSVARSTITGTGIAIFNEGATEIVDSTLARTEVGIDTRAGTVAITSSIVATVLGPNCKGSVTSGGWNLATDTSCAFVATEDLQSANPRLGPLADNGGPTRTMVPALPSPAIDHGRPGCASTDQRGVARPFDGDGNGVAVCDRGSVEATAVAQPLALTVTSTADRPDQLPGDGVCRTAVADECTLVAAVQESNATSGADVIDLQANVTYIVPAMVWQSDIVLHGHGATIQSPATHTFVGAPTMAFDQLKIIGDPFVGGLRLVDVDGASITWTAVSIAGAYDLRGQVVWNGGGAAMRGGQLDVGYGQLFGTTTLSNLASVRLKNSGSLTATKISAEIENTGAGTASIGRSRLEVRRNDGSLTIDDSSFGSTYGDPVLLVGPTTVTDSTVFSAIRTFSATTTLTNTTIVEDSETQPTVQVTGGSVSITNSIIAAEGGAPACSGPIDSGGWNLAPDASCGLDTPTDVQGVDPRLGPYNVLGGARVTFLPMTGSPAIDTGKPGCSGTDELGRPRPTDGDNDGLAECDRGALETRAYATRTFTVNSTVDAADASIGNGTCQTSVVGQCTLRAAFMEADGVNGPVTINLAAATYVLTPALADLQAAGNITVVGLAGSVIEVDALINQGGMYPITPIVVEPGSTLKVSDVTFRARTGGSTGIRNAGGAVTLTNVSVISTQAFDLASIGVDNGTGGSLTITGGSLTGMGIGVRNAAGATASVTSTTFDNSYYAGVQNAGTATIVASTFVRHQGGATDGVLHTAGTLTIGRSTFTEEVVGVRVTGGAGSIANSTVAGNTDGNLVVTGGSLTVTNSIVATLGVSVADCSHPATLLSGGWNLVSDASCGLGQPTDLAGTAPGLGPLAANGGPTMTFMPAAGSAAVDSGTPACGALDQRGKARPFDGNGDGTAVCDRGAVERGA